MASEAALIDREGEESQSTASFSWEERQILLSVLETICVLGEGWGMHCSACVWLLLPMSSACTPL